MKAVLRLSLFVVVALCGGLAGTLLLAADLDDLSKQLDRFRQLVTAEKWDEAEKQAEYVINLAKDLLGQRPDVLASFYETVGDLYFQNDRYAQAEPHYNAWAGLRNQIHGYYDAQTADALSTLGDALYYQGKYAEARQRYQQVLQIRQQVLGADHFDTGRAWKDIAWSHFEAGEYDEAARAFRTSLPIYEREQGGQSEDVATQLKKLADAYYFLLRYDEAVELYNRALAIRAKTNGVASDEYAQLLVDRADCTVLISRGAEAEADYRQAMAIHEELHGTDSAEFAAARRRLGNALIEQDRAEEGYQEVKAALAVEERLLGGESSEVAMGVSSMASALYQQARYREAEPLYRRALAIREALHEEAAIATSCHNLGANYTALGMYAQSELLYRRALEIRERIKGPEHPLVAETLSNLGALLRAQGRNDEAEPLYQRALAIREAKLPADHPDLATSYGNMANLLSAQGQYDEAAGFYDRALAIAKKLYGEDSVTYAFNLSNLANLRWNTDQTDESIRLYKQCLDIYDRKLGPVHPDLASALYDVAWCEYTLGNKDETLALLDRAVEIERQTAVSPATAFSIYHYRAQVSWDLDQKNSALADLARALDIADRQREQVSGGELERAQFFSGYSSAYERMVQWQTQLGNVDQALFAVERSRARSLLDELTLGGADLDASRPATEQDELNQQAETLRAQLVASQAELDAVPREGQTAAGEDVAAARERIRAEMVATQSELYQNYRDRRATSPTYQHLVSQGAISTAVPSLGELQRKLLNDKSRLLIYYVGANNSYLFNISNKTSEVLQLEIDADAAGELGCETGPVTEDVIRKLLLGEASVLAKLQRPTREVDPQLIKQLAALWRLLVPESQRGTLVGAGLERVYVVAGGTLALLPFEALVVAPGPQTRYFLDDGPPIYYGPSATVLDTLRIRRTNKAPAAREPVLTVGNPAYGSAGGEALASRAFVSPQQLTPLPYSGYESQWVSDVFKKVGVESARLVEADASEANFRANASGRRLIHLACHGFADREHGNLFGALALAQSGELTDPLADGFLSLAEIYDLNLKGCELAILSACETNLGPDQQGEGVWALSRGFLVAGARRVVASDWVVDDESAASLISYFCGGLAKKDPTLEHSDYGQALQAAKRWVRSQKKWEAPYYWASLVLIGPP